MLVRDITEAFMSQGDAAVVEADEMTQSDTDSQATEILHDVGVYAHLVPGNRRAKEAFSGVVDRLVQEPEWLPHARHYMQYWKDEEGQTGVRWSGHYVLDFECLPTYPNKGWRLGAGRSLRAGLEDVEFLLTTDRRKDKHVRGQHCRLNFNFESFALLLTAEKGRSATVFAEGTKELFGESEILPYPRTSFEIDNLRYELRFLDINDYRFRIYLGQLRAQFAPNVQEPPVDLAPTPSATDYRVGSYIVTKPVGLGGFSVVSVGKQISTGNLFAIKKIYKNKSHPSEISHEVKIMQELSMHGEQVCGSMVTVPKADIYKPTICRLVEVIADSAQRFDEAHLVLSPLARTNFRELAKSFSIPAMLVRVELVGQVIEGVDFLHNVGLMHRDIKPQNLAVVSLMPPRAILIDFGHATWKPRSWNHKKGTVGYLAPEVMRLKFTDSQGRYRVDEPYDNKVDVWGLGLSAYQLLCAKRMWWPSDNSQTSGIIDSLEKSSREGETRGLARIVIKMLHIDKIQRISAADAIHSFRQTVTEPYRAGVKRPMVDIT